MKDFVVAVLRPCDTGYSSSMYTVTSPSMQSVVRNFWTLEDEGVYEDSDFDGMVTIYDLSAKQVVYRYGCSK